MRSLLLRTAALLLAATAARAELLTVLSLTRHGARAPSKGVMPVCPGVFPDVDTIHDMFNAEPSCLTLVGMNEMYEVGEFIRSRYIDELEFADPDYRTSSRSWHFRARGMPRHLESGTAITNGVFPVGSGPEGYPDRSEPVAVYSEVRKYDCLLGTPPMQCSARAYADAASWASDTAPDYIKGHEDLLERVGELCGLALDDESTGVTVSVPDRVKFVGDGLDFMESSGIPMPGGLSDADHKELRALSFSMLVSSLLDSPEKSSYWLGRFPTYMAKHFKATATGSKTVLVDSNVASRELLYALGDLYQLDYDFPPLPKGKIPPGTTLLWELHRGDDDGELFVRTLVWNPTGAEREAGLRHVAVKGCAEDCPFDQFVKIAEDKFADTHGDFSSICPPMGARTGTEAELDAESELYMDYEDWDGTPPPSVSSSSSSSSAVASESVESVSGAAGVMGVAVACVLSAVLGAYGNNWVKKSKAPAAPSSSTAWTSSSTPGLPVSYGSVRQDL